MRLDLRGLERGAEITVADLEAALGGHELAPLEIVLLWTGAEDAWGRPDYPNEGSGLGRDGTLWLLDRGVKVIGTDAWGLDRPLGDLRARLRARRRPGAAVGRPPRRDRARVLPDREAPQPRRAAGRDGLHVSCLPVKIAGASAGWCRAVAVVDGA